MAVTTPEGEIPALLMGWLSGLTMTPALQIEWPDLPFTAPSGMYLRVDYLPNMNAREYLSDADPTRHMGLFQVTVVGVAGRGIVQPTDVAGKIVARFQSGTILRGSLAQVHITQKPDVGPAIVESNRTRVPVTVRWQAFI